MKRLFFILLALVFLFARYTNSKVDQKIIERQIKNIALHKKAINQMLLFYSKNGNNKKIVEILRKGANINTYDNNKKSSTYKQTPLMLATIGNHGTTVRFLLTKGANVNSQDAQGNTALHLALIWNLPDAMRKLLISNNASTSIPNNAGKTVQNLLDERQAQKSKVTPLSLTISTTPTIVK